MLQILSLFIFDKIHAILKLYSLVNLSSSSSSRYLLTSQTPSMLYISLWLQGPYIFWLKNKSSKHRLLVDMWSFPAEQLFSLCLILKSYVETLSLQSVKRQESRGTMLLAFLFLWVCFSCFYFLLYVLMLIQPANSRVCFPAIRRCCLDVADVWF